MPRLSLVSLNVERGRHLGTVLPFLERMHTDVICLQEVREVDLPLFEKAAGRLVRFAPVTVFSDEGGTSPMGIAMFSKHPTSNVSEHYYFGERSRVPRYVGLSPTTIRETMYRPLLYCDVEKEGTTYRIVTTHFTWTPDGEVSNEQRSDLAKMLSLVAEAGELTFCGDFNAPRGKEIFSELAKRFKDNIPAEYETSLDLERHRAGKEKAAELKTRMIDGLFTTPAYRARDVKLVCGVSDHCAVVADIERVG